MQTMGETSQKHLEKEDTQGFSLLVYFLRMWLWLIAVTQQPAEKCHWSNNQGSENPEFNNQNGCRNTKGMRVE